jgi:hypothetical protein
MSTTRFALPYIQASQAQKEVTHNEALLMVDALVSLSLEDRHLTAPPVSPQNGQVWFINGAGSRAWNGQVNKLAHYDSGQWYFYVVPDGLRAWIKDEAGYFVYRGGCLFLLYLLYFHQKQTVKQRVNMTLWQSASDYAAWYSAVIASAALVREVIAAIQRKKALVDFHPRPTNRIIISFRDCPQCWVDGTLESVNSDVLIGGINLKVTRKRDGATHHFQWARWESTMNDGRSSPAYAFRLYQNNPVSGLYCFEDNKTLELYDAEINALRQAFNTYLLQRFPAVAQWPDDRHQEFEEFRNSQNSNTVGNALGRIQKAIYWEAGPYTAELIFQTKRPDKEHRFTFHFGITQKEQNLLEANAARTLWQSAGLKNIMFNDVETEILSFQKNTNDDAASL